MNQLRDNSVWKYDLFIGGKSYKVHMPRTAYRSPDGKDAHIFDCRVFDEDSNAKLYAIYFSGTAFACKSDLPKPLLISRRLYQLVGSQTQSSGISTKDVDLLSYGTRTDDDHKVEVRYEILRFLKDRDEEGSGEICTMLELLSASTRDPKFVFRALNNIGRRKWVDWDSAGGRDGFEGIGVDWLINHPIHWISDPVPARDDFMNEQADQRDVTKIDLSNHRYFHLIDTQSDSLGRFAFVMMPFKEKEFPQRIYTDIIKPEVKECLGIECVIVSEDFFKNDIPDKIYSHLVRAEFVIAELSTRNPNVAFEFGMAMVMGKRYIPLAFKETMDNEMGLPFDYRNLDTIIYDSDAELRTKLRKALLALKPV